MLSSFTKFKKNLNIKLEKASDYIEILKNYTIPVQNSTIAGNRLFEGFGILDPRKLETWIRTTI